MVPRDQITLKIHNYQITRSYLLFSALNPDDSESQIKTGPFINPELSPNVTGVLGKEVRLACHVEHLGNKTVRSPIKRSFIS